jgi:hypothetical protein
MKHSDHRALREKAERGGHAQTRVPDLVPVLNEAVRVEAEYLHSVHTNIRQQLDILRKTRGQREVGTVKIPPHLQTNSPLDVRGVEERGSVLPIRGVRD